MYTPAKLKTTKATCKQNLCLQYSVSINTSCLGVICIKDPSIAQFLAEGLSSINVSAIVLGIDGKSFPNIAYANNLNINDVFGLDFFVFDGDSDAINVVDYMKAGVVPILPVENIFGGIIKPFNPMTFEGNGFLYTKTNPFCIFERIIAFLENIRFPEDKRILLKNVADTF